MLDFRSVAGSSAKLRIDVSAEVAFFDAVKRGKQQPDINNHDECLPMLYLGHARSTLAVGSHKRVPDLHRRNVMLYTAVQPAELPA
jgi:hypothetical protein